MDVQVIENVSVEAIASKIYLIRGVKVMLDRDLAELYGVKTKRLKEQVRRNTERFPDDFMFELSKNEFKNLRSQFATSSWGGSRYAPMAFTEHGVLMLSSVLKSDRAIKTNIQIVRVFAKIRRTLLDDGRLRMELGEFKRVTEDRFQVVFETLDQLLTVNGKPNKEIGYMAKEEAAIYGKQDGDFTKK